MRNIKISLLEFGSRDSNDSLSTINDILEYAIKADELNFNRIWLAEHHSFNRMHPYTNPEILITLIAGNTDKIRVGAGGSLIGYYSPYLIASNYKLLNNIFNNRIDLGLSKGKPDNINKHDYFKLRDESHEDLFSKNLEAICELLFEEEKNFLEKEIVLPPFSGTRPDLWYLSKSYSYLDVSIEKKLNYCRSLLHGVDVSYENYEKDKLTEYKENFNKVNGYLPSTALAIGVSFSKTKVELENYEPTVVNKKQALRIFSVTGNSLHDLLLNYQSLYGIDEFVIYDCEANNKLRIDNLYAMQELFSL